MIGSSPPFHVSQQLWGKLRRGPRAACQSRHPVTNAQIHPLAKSGVQPSGEAHPLQGVLESGLCSQAHHRRDPRQLTPPVAFLHLAVDQTRRHLPPTCYPPSTTFCEPLSKMGRQRIKVQVEAITGEERETARSQDLSQSMDDRMCHVLCAGTKVEDRNDLCEGIDGQPEPEHVCGAT